MVEDVFTSGKVDFNCRTVEKCDFEELIEKAKKEYKTQISTAGAGKGSKKTKDVTPAEIAEMGHVCWAKLAGFPWFPAEVRQ